MHELHTNGHVYNIILLRSACLCFTLLSQGIFLKLIEDACHEFNLNAALIHSGESILSPSFAAFVQKLQELKKAKVDHGAAQQNLEALMKMKMYSAIMIAKAKQEKRQNLEDVKNSFASKEGLYN